MKNYAAFAWTSAAILGFLAVLSGAMGAHALESVLDAKSLDAYETAVRFQMYHAILLIGLGILAHTFESKLLHWAIWSIVMGTICFSGSIYLIVLLKVPVFLVTPLGGTILMIGWGILIVWAIRQFQPEKEVD